MSEKVTRPGFNPSWLLLPALIFLAANFVIPLGRLVVISVTGSAELFGNYVRAFDSGIYVRSIINTLEISVIVTVLCLILGYPIAFIMANGRRLTSMLVGGLIIVPYFIAVLIRSYGWIILLGSAGPINSSLLWLGLIEEPAQLIFTRGAVIVAMTAVLLPMMVMPLYSAFRSIDSNLLRAAGSLGATPAAAFFKIYLPLTKAGALAGSIIVFILGLGFFVTPTLVGGPRDRVISMDIAAQAGQITSPGFIEAIAVMLLVVTLGVLLIASRFVNLGSIWGATSAAASTVPRLAKASKDRPTRSESVRLWLSDNVSWPLLLAASRIPPVAGKVLASLITGVVLTAIAASIVIVILLSFSSSSFLNFPPPGWSFRWYGEFFESTRWIKAFMNSLWIGVLTAIFTLVLGLLTAIGLVRGKSRFKGLVVSIILGPMIVPGVVIAISLYWFYLWTGVKGSTIALVMAHALGALPLVVLIVSSNLQAIDHRFELAAQSAGASPLRVLWHITLPLAAPGMIVGGLFAFLHSFDELILTIFVRGLGQNTLPIELWSDLNFHLSPVLAVVSTLNIALVLAVLGLLLLVQRRAKGKATAAATNHP